MTATMTPGTATKTATVHILGVRHHGPGSARSLRVALEALEPDIVLLEGPPDANHLFEWAAHAEMAPPVALLVYRPDKPRESVYYPFALFSPEWQAILYATKAGIPARFMDLPLAHQFGQEEAKTSENEPPEEPQETPSEGEPPEPSEPAEAAEPDESAESARRLRVDPLQVLAEAAGFNDGERWWEYLVEHRRDGADLFAAILEAMAAVRDDAPPVTCLHELRREAYMRQTIRTAQAEGKQKIAVVCGAWHAPALLPERWPKAREDSALLKGLPRTKTAAAWIPWTHGRLSYASGYGAGVTSPGWYHHLWTAPDQVVNRWMVKVARLLREQGIDASSASVIESVRLAESLAALRDRPLPGLLELSEAVRSVFCFGDDTPMRLIHQALIVGEVLGHVPSDSPMVPLQQDLTRLQKRLRLAPDASQTTKVLDLREPNDLERSQLLHRLNLLELSWGRLVTASGKGTFKEAWQLQWHPEFMVTLIVASTWGTTIAEAAVARAHDLSERLTDLRSLTELLDRALLADLADAIAHIMGRIEARAATAGDVTQLMEALPPLAKLLRYDNVRKTDRSMVAHAVGGIVTRICIGLPLACASLDDAAAETMFSAIAATDSAIQLIQDEEHLAPWRNTLEQISTSERLHQLIAGRCCRILLDAQRLDTEEAAQRMNLAVSTAAEPAHAAAWVEGFLKGSGELLYYDDSLFGIFDAWLTSLSAETFPRLLPLLRRTFGTFEPPLRRNLGEKARRAASSTRPAKSAPTVSADFDAERAATVLPLVAQLLGLAPGAAMPQNDQEPNS